MQRPSSNNVHFNVHRLSTLFFFAYRIIHSVRRKKKCPGAPQFDGFLCLQSRRKLYAQLPRIIDTNKLCVLFLSGGSLHYVNRGSHACCFFFLHFFFNILINTVFDLTLHLLHLFSEVYTHSFILSYMIYNLDFWHNLQLE